MRSLPPTLSKVFLTVAIALSVAPAYAIASPSSIVLPDGTVQYEFGRRPLPTVSCKPYHVCDIALDNGERIINMVVGNPEHWSISNAQTGQGEITPHVLVKTNDVGLETNMIITTNKREYNIVLRSSEAMNYPGIRFFYPDEDAAAKAVIAEREHADIQALLAGTPAVPQDRLDTGYFFNGDSSLLPVKVYNDGQRTYIQWIALPNDLPTVTLPTDKNTAPQLANFRLIGSTYVIDGVNPAYDLIWNLHTRNERVVAIRHGKAAK